MIFDKINDYVICFIGSKMKWHITTYILRAALFSLYDIFTLSNTNYRKRNINGEQQRLIQYCKLLTGEIISSLFDKGGH
jgi:hypothetical protein